MIKILLADDHALMREGLKKLLALDSGIAVVAEARTGVQVMDAIRKEAIDVVLLDLSMPGASGPDLIRRIRAQAVSPRVLVLSMHREAQVVRRTLAAGACGYLTKDCNPKALTNAIYKAAAGGRVIDPGLAELFLFDGIPSMEKIPHERLTGREYDILCLLVGGKSVNEIARDLAISNKTVSTHKSRLMQKLNCKNNAQLFRYAIQHQIIDSI